MRGIRGVDLLATNPFFIKLVFGWYDDPLPLYGNQQVDNAEFSEQARAIRSRLKDKGTPQDELFYNRLLHQEARLERGEIRLPNAALLALGRDPILRPLPRGQDRGGEIDLFDGFDYTSLTPEERLVAMLHSYRFVSRGSRLHLSTILL